jgi:hypothetical protein
MCRGYGLLGNVLTVCNALAFRPVAGPVIAVESRAITSHHGRPRDPHR